MLRFVDERWEPIKWTNPGISCPRRIPKSVISGFGLNADDLSIRQCYVGTNSRIFIASSRGTRRWAIKLLLNFDHPMTLFSIAKLVDYLHSVQVPTKRCVRTAVGELVWHDRASNSYWECSEFIPGERPTGTIEDARKAARSAGRLHRVLCRAPQSLLCANEPYWMADWASESFATMIGKWAQNPPLKFASRAECVVLATYLSHCADSLTRTLAKPQMPSNMHGDLHLDNLIITKDEAYILDFDVARQEDRGQETDCGVLIHRLVRESMVQSGKAELDDTALEIICTFCKAYYSENPRVVDVRLCLERALLESLRKIRGCYRLWRMNCDSGNWSLFLRHHLAYVREIKEIIDLWILGTNCEEAESIERN
jgi:Phosphotransferase enzyme family